MQHPNYVWPMGLSFYLTISPLHPPNLKGFPSFSNRLVDVQREGQSRNNSFPLTDAKLFNQQMSANEPSSDKFSSFLWAYEDLYFPGRLTEFWILSLRMYWLNNNQSYSSFFFFTCNWSGVHILISGDIVEVCPIEAIFSAAEIGFMGSFVGSNIP